VALATATELDVVSLPDALDRTGTALDAYVTNAASGSQESGSG
jgi:hypothetical protein